MTVAASALSAGSTPTAVLSTVDNHFHLALGIPVELPVVTSSNNGQILKVDNGAWVVGNAPTGVPDVTASENGYILQVSNGVWAAVDALPTTMVGATSSAAGASGLVPAPTSADVDKFLAGDGTYKSGGLPMVILSYGNSTWNDFINAYNNNVIVYCRASSNANPKTGVQGRMAFMAFCNLNSSGTPTSVEFQYYRSVSSHSGTQLCDQVFIYKLESSGTWSVTTREAGIKQVTCTATGLTTSFNASTGTFTIADAT